MPEPIWIQAEIPRSTRIKLWRIIRDHQTYSGWNKAIEQAGDLFSAEEYNRLPKDREALNLLRKEVTGMALRDVTSLPWDLQQWVFSLRPDLDENTAPGIPATADASVFLDDELSRIANFAIRLANVQLPYPIPFFVTTIRGDKPKLNEGSGVISCVLPDSAQTSGTTVRFYEYETDSYIEDDPYYQDYLNIRPHTKTILDTYRKLVKEYVRRADLLLDALLTDCKREMEAAFEAELQFVATPLEIKEDFYRRELGWIKSPEDETPRLTLTKSFLGTACAEIFAEVDDPPRNVEYKYTYCQREDGGVDLLFRDQILAEINLEDISRIVEIHRSLISRYCSPEKKNTLPGYCVKCRAKRDMQDIRSVTLKNDTASAQGYCPVCGTKMFRFGKWVNKLENSQTNMAVDILKVCRQTWWLAAELTILAIVEQGRLFISGMFAQKVVSRELIADFIDDPPENQKFFLSYIRQGEQGILVLMRDYFRTVYRETSRTRDNYPRRLDYEFGIISVLEERARLEFTGLILAEAPSDDMYGLIKIHKTLVERFSSGKRLINDEIDNCRHNWEACGQLRLVSSGKKEWTLPAYCVKCRAKQNMRDVRSITLKNGFPSAQGYCPVCGTKMFRFGQWFGNDEAADSLPDRETRERPWTVL
jgi:uncharacterized protein DUF5679